MYASLPRGVSAIAVVFMLAGFVQAFGNDVGPCQAGDACQLASEAECTTPTSCGPLAAFAGLCDPCRCCPRWTLKGEGIYLQRSTTRNQPLFVDGTGETLLNSQTMDFPVEFGPKISAIRHTECGLDLEVGYFAVDGFASEAAVPGLSYMVTDVNPASLIASDAQVRYASALYNGEVNVRQQWCEWITLLAGYRLVELDERYDANGTYSALGIGTTNHLHGFQLGADVEVYNMGGPLLIDAFCRAAVFDNFVNQSSTQITGQGTDTLRDSHERAAFLGEAGVVATFALTQHLAFRASYQTIWLEGVALAPEQISAVNFARSFVGVNSAGGVFYHGAGLGFEYRF